MRWYRGDSIIFERMWASPSGNMQGLASYFMFGDAKLRERADIHWTLAQLS